jgi:hypothetical protein
MIAVMLIIYGILLVILLLWARLVMANKREVGQRSHPSYGPDNMLGPSAADSSESVGTPTDKLTPKLASGRENPAKTVAESSNAAW